MKAFRLAGLVTVICMCSWGTLPELSLAQLAEHMKRGEANVSSIRFEMKLTLGPLRPGSSVPFAADSSIPPKVLQALNEQVPKTTVHEYCYRMKHDFTFRYIREDTGFETAYNGEFTTEYNGAGYGFIWPAKPLEGDILTLADAFRYLYYLACDGDGVRYCDNFPSWDEWQVNFAAPQVFEGQECYVVEIRDPKLTPAKAAKLGPIYRWLICPRFGFSVVENLHYPDIEGQDGPRMRGRFSDFREVSPGIWLPSKYETWSTQTGRKGTTEFRYLGVNEVIDDREFVVHFPAGTTVDDRRTGVIRKLPQFPAGTNVDGERTDTQLVVPAASDGHPPKDRSGR